MFPLLVGVGGKQIQTTIEDIHQQNLDFAVFWHSLSTTNWDCDDSCMFLARQCGVFIAQDPKWFGIQKLASLLMDLLGLICPCDRDGPPQHTQSGSLDSR